MGGIAVFFPYVYAEIFHPNLSNSPIDFIMRTGILWLIFAVFQVWGVFTKKPEKIFFLVGIIRLMEVPADIVYSVFAIGSPLLSKLLILSAPVLNFIFGTYLLLLSKKLEKNTAD